MDASNVAIGAVLSQKDDKNFDHPIYYVSRQSFAAKRNYTTIEWEALGMVYSIQKFCHYLLGNPFVFHVDHDALKYMINKPQLSGQIARWVLLLQEFKFTIHVRPCKKYANANHLSWLINELGGDPTPNSFLDVALFVVDVIFEEYADLLQYLTHHNFPPHFTNKMKTQLVHKSAPHTLIGGVLRKGEMTF